MYPPPPPPPALTAATTQRPNPNEGYCRPVETRQRPSTPCPVVAAANVGSRGRENVADAL